MSNKIKRIIGISAEIEDENTGVPASFHVISNMNVSFKYGSSQATLDSYFSRKHFDQGKQALGSQVVTLHGVPEDGQCSKAWAYHNIVAQIPDGTTDGYGNQIMPHAFTGGELVEV